MGCEQKGWNGGDEERMVTLGLGSWEALGNHCERSWSGEGVGGTTGWEPPLPPQEGKGRKGRGGEVGASGDLISGKGNLRC